MKREISQEHIERYLETTREALDKLKILAPDPSYLFDIANDFLNMAESYFKDALHFYENDDYVNALSCVNYAHGWLDAGARLGLFDVQKDYRLFTLQK